MKLEGKKLLFLGANPETADLVRIAKEMGVYTIVTDYNPGAPAKKVADKSYNVNGIDVDALEKLAHNEKVDGVLVGVADPLIGPYQQLCERLGLPAYAETAEQVNVLVNKYNFKRTCEKYGIPGIPEYKLDNSVSPEDVKNLPYPVLIKPVDSNSGKGMTLCYDENDVAAAVKKAVAESKTQHFIAEKYMTCDDAFMYFTFKDGKYYLSAIADRFTNHEQKGHDNVVVGGVYPSKYAKMYMEKYHDRFCRMFADLKIRNGVFLVQAFVENDTIYVYDPGFRLQGGAPHLLVNSINGFDHRKMLINLALTGSMGNDDLDAMNDPMFLGKYAGSIVFLLKKGIICKISGIDEVKKIPGVVSVIQRLNEGDEVYNIGTEQQVLVRIHLYEKDKAEFIKTIKQIKQLIKVKDVDGNDMLLNTINEDEI